MSCYSGKTLWTTLAAWSQRMLEDTKKSATLIRKARPLRGITEKAETITNAVSKWHSICLMYRAFANYLAFRDVAAASALTSLSAIALSLRSASPSSSSVAWSLSAASLSPNRVASVRAVPYPAIS